MKRVQALIEMLANWTTVMIFVGSVIALLGGAIAAYKQSKFDDDLKKKNEEILTLNKQLAQISLYTLNTITGADSFATVSFSNNQPYTKLDRVSLTHYGNFPLYDLKIDIYSLLLNKNIVQLNIPNFGSIPKIASHLLTDYQIPYDLTMSEEHRFNVFFYARNGYWIQQVIYKKVNSGWSIASVVKRHDSEGKFVVIKKDISPDFPNKADDIDWQ